MFARCDNRTRDGSSRTKSSGHCSVRSETVRSLSGQPLGSAAREFLEPRFGHDFSRVRVHTDAPAARSAAILGARAFTTNNHIVFGSGEYAPQTEAGRRLLSHELTHVVQQGRGVHLKSGFGEDGDAYEAHADAVADLVASGKRAGALLQRMPGSGLSASAEMQPPIQMQKAQQQSPAPPIGGDPKAKWLQQSLQRLIEKEALTKQVNGAAARALAKAYLNRKKRPSGLHATTYLDDRLPADPGESEVYAALLNVMDVSQAAKPGNWKWTPPPFSTEGETEDSRMGEFDRWAVEQAVDYVKDEARDKAIEKIAARCAARWSAAEGLVVVAEIVIGALSVYGWISLAASVLELVILLQKPVKKMSRSELIAADVKAWLRLQQESAQAEREQRADASNLEKSLTKIPSMAQDNLRPVPIRVRQPR
jgi:hypothetical protein